MDGIPFIDWNNNEQIDLDDIAISLAISDEETKLEEDDDDDIQ